MAPTSSASSGPPESVAGVAVSSRSILISWLPPSMPNGRIREYRIAVTEENTDTETQLISTSLSRLITGLHPFYIYSIKVTAVTVAEGPYASPIEIKTFSDGKKLLLWKCTYTQNCKEYKVFFETHNNVCFTLSCSSQCSSCYVDIK